MPSNPLTPFHKPSTIPPRPDAGAYHYLGPSTSSTPRINSPKDQSPSSRRISRDREDNEDESDEDLNEGEDPNVRTVKDSLAKFEAATKKGEEMGRPNQPQNAEDPSSCKPSLGEAKLGLGFHKEDGIPVGDTQDEDLSESQKAQLEQQMARMNRLHASRQQAMQGNVPEAPKMPPTSRQEQKKRAMGPGEEDEQGINKVEEPWG